MIRMSTAQMYSTNLNGLMQSYGKLNQVNNQMTANKRVLTPADDPVATAQTLNTRVRMGVVQQYNRNIDFADKNLSLTESALDQTESSLTRLKELAIQLGSGQWSDEQIKASGLEAKEVLSHLQGLVNTRNESDEYIFAGSQADRKAYDGNVFQGDKVEREAQVADDTLIQMLTSGARAFENLSGLTTSDPAVAVFTDDGSQDLSATPKEYANNMLGVIQYFVDATGNGTDGTLSDVDQQAIRASIDNLDIAFEQASKTRAQIGARQNTLAAVKDSNENFELFAKQSISDLEDLDWGDAYVRLQASMMSYQAGMQVTGQISGLSLFNYI